MCATAPVGNLRPVTTGQRLAIEEDHVSGGIALVGELDVATSDLLDTRLAAIDASRTVELDLAGISFLDSSALRVLIAHHQRLGDGGGRLTLHRVPAEVRRVLEIAGLVDRLVAD